MRSVAILTGPFTHLDHLGILSSLLDIPLIVTEASTYAIAHKWYPDLDVQLVDLSHLSIEYLANNFDLIFQSGKFWVAEMDPAFTLFTQKKMRFVFCPHGNSDKGHSLKTHPEQDLYLVYGNHLFDLLQRTGALKQIKEVFKTGNYRWHYYQEHLLFYQNLVQDRLSHFKESKPLILYAPTWGDQENYSSFLDATDQLIDELCLNFNLLIKLHPFLEEKHPSAFYRIWAKYENHPSVLFVSDIPSIYPLLAQCVAYLGDYSSIGYDALTLDLPLYFLAHDSSFSLLHSCGLVCPLDNLCDFILKTIHTKQVELSDKRKEMYRYVFEETINLDTLKKAIYSACTS